MTTQPVPRPVVRWVMDLGPIIELCRFVTGAALFGASVWVGANR